MTWLKASSLERYLSYKLWLLALPCLLLWLGFSYYINLPVWAITVGFILLVLFILKVMLAIKDNINTSFTRAILHLEAINQEDYNQHGKAPFSSGTVAVFHQQLKQLSERLQQQKSRYDQHAFLVYQLITQLDAPILVFNEKQQLTFGNDAFYHLYGQHWQMLRHASPELLSLELAAHESSSQETLSDKTLSDKVKSQKWQFTSAEKKQKWQIRQSEFIDGGQRHQLLIFIDIETALRANQLNAWQQIIRVLGHEIGNSLAPVSSMAESLASKTNNERDKMVLAVITERCQHLQRFVSRYGELAKPLQLSQQWFLITPWFANITQLYENITFSLELNSTTKSLEKLWADETLVAQVFINLCKNSQEANATKITLQVSHTAQHFVLALVDNGHGFSNLENLFVPLYSTKQNGQGIGLNFCRNIVEQHQGNMSLTNNKNQGVTVTVCLPLETSIDNAK